MFEKDKANLLAVVDAIKKSSSLLRLLQMLLLSIIMCKAFDATLMNFIVIGESVKRISSEVKQMNSFIEWKKIAGFRDIVAHDYFGVDTDEIWEIINTHLPKLKKDIDGIIKNSNLIKGSILNHTL